MRGNRIVVLVILLGLSLVLAACGGQASAGQEAGQKKVTQPAANLVRTDDSGAVTFRVTPLNLDAKSTTLEFEVNMDTHSVELGFDLASMAVLRTDTGAEVAPLAYRGGKGHHVKGRLSFPEAPVEGSRTLILVIRNVAGIAERIFTWQLLS